MRYLIVLVVVASTVVVGQEGPTTLAANYKVQFENAWVKVTAVRYEPFQKLPGHAHTPNPSAYVYLNDGPPVRFRHIGGHNVVATRPATKAGALRVYRGLEEIHEVENTGDTPSVFLRVEVKTAGVAPEAFRGKFERPEPGSAVVTQFDHPQLRIARVWAAPGQQVDIVASAEPVLLVALREGAGFSAGQERWLAPGARIQVKNTTAGPVDFLRFEFKTQPVATRR